VDELVSSLRARHLHVTKAEVRAFVSLMGDSSVEHFLEVLDGDIHEAQGRGKKYSHLWLKQTARRAANTWADGQEAARVTPGRAPRAEKPPMPVGLQQTKASMDMIDEMRKRSRERNGG